MAQAKHGAWLLFVTINIQRAYHPVISLRCPPGGQTPSSTGPHEYSPTIPSFTRMAQEQQTFKIYFQPNPAWTHTELVYRNIPTAIPIAALLQTKLVDKAFWLGASWSRQSTVAAFPKEMSLIKSQRPSLGSSPTSGAKLNHLQH